MLEHRKAIPTAQELAGPKLNARPRMCNLLKHATESCRKDRLTNSDWLLCVPFAKKIQLYWNQWSNQRRYIVVCLATWIRAITFQSMSWRQRHIWLGFLPFFFFFIALVKSCPLSPMHFQSTGQTYACKRVRVLDKRHINMSDRFNVLQLRCQPSFLLRGFCSPSLCRRIHFGSWTVTALEYIYI